MVYGIWKERSIGPFQRYHTLTRTKFSINRIHVISPLIADPDRREEVCNLYNPGVKMRTKNYGTETNSSNHFGIAERSYNLYSMIRGI